MKKRKTYEISVIDKTYSNTISDETKFYTSDTALELGFELKETEYTFESAEIVLLNIDDRSLVTRPVAKVNNDFVYELDDDITAHYGEWRGQVRFEQAGEIYVSSPVKFRIENDLSNDRPPQLSDVQSWVSLKRYADSLTEELKQAVLSVEGIEDTFNKNELGRQTIFETAEQSRQTTFETNESERDDTFSTNEATRQTQELEREKAEGARQTVFDDNEAGRGENFNANEATRQENETTRQSAELIRVENEILRVERDNNRELEIDEIKNNVVHFSGVEFDNLVVNGDFKDGLTKWVTINNAVVSVTSEGAEILSTKNGLQLHQGVSVPTNDVLYSAVVVKTDTPTNFVYATNQKVVPINSSSQDFHLLSSLEKRLSYPYLSINAINSDGSPKKITLKYMMAFNLTSIFGAGNEPSKEIMDWIIKNNGYFDELTLRRDDIQQYEINQLRKAVLALGGTI